MSVATPRRRRPPLVAIVSYALRTCVSRRRWVGLVRLAAAAVGFGAIAATATDTRDHAFAVIASEALFGLILPVTCLVVGDAVLGAEVRAGSFAFTWMSPVPTWMIAVGRWLAGTVVAGGCAAAAFALAAVVAGAPSSAGPAAVAALFGAVAYIAVFVAIGCVTRRAAVWSLAFVFLVERLLGEALAGIAQLSPSWEARAAFITFSDGPRSLVRSGIPHGTAALVRLCVIAAVMLVASSSRLRHLQLTGEAD